MGLWKYECSCHHSITASEYSGFNPRPYALLMCMELPTFLLFHMRDTVLSHTKFVNFI